MGKALSGELSCPCDRSCGGMRFILSLLFNFGWKILLANNVDPDQMPHYVASDLGLHCLTLLGVSR